MAFYSVLRSKLVTRALQAADMEADVAGTRSFVSATEVKDLVTESMARFHDLTIDICGAESFAIHADDLGNVSVGPDFSATILLPSNFYRLVSVHICDTGTLTNFQAVERVEWNGPEMTTLLGAPPSEGPHWYTLTRRSFFVETAYASSWVGQLKIWPTPIRNRTLWIMYVPTFYRVADPSIDPTYDGIDGWDRWVVLDVAIELLGKEESDTSRLERQRDRIEQQMRKAQGKQDSHRARVPQDIRGAQRGRVRWPR